MGYNQVPENRIPYIQANIKRLMKEKGFKQQDLADQSGLSLDTIKKIFRKKTVVAPSFFTLDRIATALGTTYESLLLANYNQMLSDERIAKIVLDEHNLQENISKSSYANQFQVALLENGYDDILVFINYLQFLGYEITFIPIKAVPLRSVQCQQSNSELKKMQKEKQNSLNALENTRTMLKQKLSHLTCCDSGYGEIAEELDFTEIEIQALTESLKNMNIQTHQNHYRKKLTMEQVIKELNRLSKLDATSLKAAIHQLNINVCLSSYTLKNDKLISFSEFYNLCETFSEDIHHKINELN